jgi:hypothetical protein
VESSERIGSTINRVGAHSAYGIALALDSEWQSARETLEFALHLGRTEQSGGFFYEPQILTALTDACLGLGDAPRAREIAELAIEAAVRTQIRAGEVRARLARARVLLTLDGVDARGEVESMLERAQAIVSSTGARAYEPQIHVERARLAGLLSDDVGRQQWLREAHRLFTEMGATGRAERVALRLEESPR